MSKFSAICLAIWCTAITVAIAIGNRPPKTTPPAADPVAVSTPLTGAQQAWVRDCILHNHPGGNGAQYDVDRCIEYAHLLPWSE